ncbi:MAG TPA: diaminopimelate epimerase [Patescibacteria group bacterium]|nr:diaminopimelate epimerase [Patescibacteria group bacterium]
MIFYKTSSFGNDFIEIDSSELASLQGGRSLGDLAREICDRQRGVGADGAVFYRFEKRRFFFEIFNRDGSTAELSGNGMAGLAAVLLHRRLAASPLLLQAAIGTRRVDLLARRGPVFQFDVEIGRPDFSNRKSFPFLKHGQERFTCEGLEFYPVSVGNPHAVVFCRERLDHARLAVLGKKLESHPMFPARVNVEFVQFTDAENCRVFFYERGVGPTLASSTGSAAVFAVLRRLGKVKDRLAIECGTEKIVASWKRGIFIHNLTRLICRGNYFGQSG